MVVSRGSAQIHAALFALLLVSGLPRAVAAQTTAGVLHVFTGTAGAAPQAGLTEGYDGRLYGTTTGPGGGTIFRLAQDGSGFETLYVFGSSSVPSDGAVPSRGRLVQDAEGMFFGTTYEGGANGYGTVYRLDVSGATPSVSILHSFDSDTRHPASGVIVSSGGMLYGTTAGDGINRLGTVYRLNPDGSAFEVLHSFNGGDGARPAGGVIEASDGWLYGTTENGGANGAGTVFRIGQDGTGFSVLASVFGHPAAGVTEVPGTGGTRFLYGVESGPSAVAPYGRLFRLDIDTLQVDYLAPFTGGAHDGAFPRSPLLPGRDGALYGTASAGASGCSAGDCGVVFRVLPSGAPQAIHQFTLANGGTPDGALVLARDGHLYGTASTGGTPASGTGTGEGVVWTVRNPGTVPLVFTGPGNAPEGGGVSYFLSLDNTTTSILPGPFVVDVSPSAGLQLAVQPPLAGWTCTVGASGPSCVWPTDLPPGAVTDTVGLSFDVVAPFTADCGIGPSPCVTAGARLRDMGVTVNASAPVTTASNAPPLAADDAVFVVGNLPTTVNVLENDSDPDNDTLSVIEIVVPPGAGQVVAFTADGSVTYVPFDALNRPDTFRYRVSDGRGATATAMVTVTPRIPTLITSRTLIDIGPVAVGRVAAGRTTVFSDAEISGPVRFEQVSAQEIQAALAGTGYDLADAVSDPDAFRDLGGWTAWPQGSMLLLYYRPLTVGRVSVARAVLTSDIPGLESVTRSVIIIGAAADPATAPLRAADDTATTRSGTPVVVDVLANDGGESGGGRPLYVSFSGACPSIDFFAGICDVQGPVVGGSVTAPPSITGPQNITVNPLPVGATGTAKTLYASSELEACFDPPRQPGPCLLEGNMYFATLTVDVVPREQADLDVSLAATPGAVPLGEAVTVTVTVSNAGPDTARTVMFTGLGLLGLHHTFERVTPSRGLCFPYSAATGLVCALGDLAAGESATVEVVARASAQVFDGVGDPQVGVLLSANVESVTDDPDPANNARFSSYVVRRSQADLGVSLTATPGAVPLGEAVTVTVTVTNAGPDTARAVMFTGLGLLGVHHAFERVTPSRGICFSYSAATGLVCALGDLAAGLSATVEVVARASAQVFDGVTDPQVGVLLSANVESVTDDPDPANNARFISYVVRRSQPDLVATLTSSPSSVEAGSPVTLTATVRNLGPEPATNIVVTGLADLTSFVNVTVGVSIGSCAPAQPGLDVVCTIGALAPNATATVTFVGTPPTSLFVGNANNSLQWGAGITAQAVESDPSPVNNAAATTFSVTRPTARPDLRILSAGFYSPLAASATPLTAARVGDEVELRVTVQNVGDAASGAVWLTGRFAELEFLGQIPPCGGTWQCPGRDLTAGSTRTLVARYRILPSALPAGQTSSAVSGTATVYSATRGFTGGTRPAEINLADNSTVLTLTVLDQRRPDLRILSADFHSSLAAPTTPLTTGRVGDEVELRVTVQNVGDAASGAVWLTGRFAELEFLGQIPPCGGTWQCPGRDLTAGSTRTLVARYRVLPSALPAGQTSSAVSGTATVYSATRGFTGGDRPAEINLADNSTVLTLTVLDQRRPDLRILSADFHSSLAAPTTPLTTARVGDEVELRVTVQNVGDAASGAVWLTGRFAELEFLGQIPPCGGTWQCPGRDLTAGSTRTLVARYRVLPSALPAGQTSSAVSGTATVYSATRGFTGGTRPAEINLADNSVQATLTILPALNLFP